MILNENSQFKDADSLTALKTQSRLDRRSHTFNPRTPEAEADRFMSLKPTCTV